MPSKAINKAVVSAPFGSVELSFEDEALIKCELSEEMVPENLGSYAEHPAVLALKAYLAGKTDALNGWPAAKEGSPFRLRVWNEIAKIHAGSTKTYGEIAQALGSSPRAVGSACGDNPLPIFVGCHRVVGKGTLGGFMHNSAVSSIKYWLLKHENAPEAETKNE